MFKFDMKCYKCNSMFGYTNPASLDDKLIELIKWDCPNCKTENREYYPKFYAD